ncbi:hypothetical protein ACTTAM_02325 [Rhodobacter capsulatus]
MAVPGHPMDARAAGCNMLIRDGAVLIRGAEDVIEAMGLEAAPRAEPRPDPRPSPQPAAAAKAGPMAAVTGLRARLLALLGPAPTPEDTVIRDLGIDAATLSREVIGLEIEGEITRHPGGLLSRG